MVFRIRTALALAAVLAGAVACASPPRAPAAVDGVRAYRIGYADGCSNGFKAAAGQSDAVSERGELGGRDRLYLEGWVAGHYTCRLLADRPGWQI